MLIAVPVDADMGLSSPCSGHFGRAPHYALVDSESRTCAVIRNESSHHGGTKLPPEWLADQGVHVLLCGGLGGRAIELCQAYGIVVYVGQEGTVAEFVDAYSAGSLHCATLDDGCTQHAAHPQHEHAAAGELGASRLPRRGKE